MKKYAFLYIYVTLLVGVIVHPGWAGNWFYQTTLSSQLEGDDNKRLRTSDEEGTVGVELRGTLEFSKKSETSDLYIRGGLSSDRYDGDDEGGLDTDDQYLYTGGKWKGERSEFSVDGEFRRESSLFTELEDTGRFGQVERRVTKSVTPEFAYDLFENTQLITQFYYTDVEFPNDIPLGLTEYDYMSANIGLSHNINERNSISFSIFHSMYEADTFDSDVDTTGGNLRYSKIINEFWFAYGSVGYRDSNFKNVVGGITVRDGDTGALYEVGAVRQSELSRLEFSLSNELQPSASGEVNERDEYRINYLRTISERWTGGANILWLENQSINSDNDRDDREYLSAELYGEFRLTPYWYLTGRYRHRDQEFTNSPNSDDANSDAIIFGIRYSGREKAL